MQTEFNFAGFNFPRYVVRMACGPSALRKKWSGRKVCGEYFHAPKPNNAEGRGFYLDDAGQPFTRWQWADEVVNLRHTGWFCDEHQDSKIRGIVALLPHGRFLAGYSMGEHMASSIDADIYTDIESAARAADSLAENAADTERDYQASQQTEENEA